MITFTLETISPEVARQYLERNKNNRSITKERVLALLRDIQSGAFAVTHQCIAFNKHGDLIDGQHRLTAIVQSGATVQMYVARYERTETAMALPFDRGLVRKHHDVLDVSKREAEVACAMLRLQNPAKLLTANEIQQCLVRHGDMIKTVIGYGASNVKHRASAGAKAAMVLLCRRHPEDNEVLLDQYAKFVALNIDGMWSSVAACVRAMDNLRASGGGSMQRSVMARVWYAFKPENKDLKIVRIMDEPALLAEMIEYC